MRVFLWSWIATHQSNTTPICTSYLQRRVEESHQVRPQTLSQTILVVVTTLALIPLPSLEMVLRQWMTLTWASQTLIVHVTMVLLMEVKMFHHWNRQLCLILQYPLPQRFVWLLRVWKKELVEGTVCLPLVLLYSLLLLELKGTSHKHTYRGDVHRFLLMIDLSSLHLLLLLLLLRREEEAVEDTPRLTQTRSSLQVTIILHRIPHLVVGLSLSLPPLLPLLLEMDILYPLQTLFIEELLLKTNVISLGCPLWKSSKPNPIA